MAKTSGVTPAGSSEGGYSITQSFIDEMVTAFRQQKKVHVRFAFEIVMAALRTFKVGALGTPLPMHMLCIVKPMQTIATMTTKAGLPTLLSDSSVLESSKRVAQSASWVSGAADHGGR